MTPHPVKRRGHPGTLHLWWARRPQAAARALIFCQMVDDHAAQELGRMGGREYISVREEEHSKPSITGQKA